MANTVNKGLDMFICRCVFVGIVKEVCFNRSNATIEVVGSLHEACPQEV